MENNEELFLNPLPPAIFQNIARYFLAALRGQVQMPQTASTENLNNFTDNAYFKHQEDEGRQGIRFLNTKAMNVNNGNMNIDWNKVKSTSSNENIKKTEALSRQDSKASDVSYQDIVAEFKGSFLSAGKSSREVADVLKFLVSNGQFSKSDLVKFLDGLLNSKEFPGISKEVQEKIKDLVGIIKREIPSDNPQQSAIGKAQGSDGFKFGGKNMADGVYYYYDAKKDQVSYINSKGETGRSQDVSYKPGLGLIDRRDGTAVAFDMQITKQGNNYVVAGVACADEESAKKLQDIFRNGTPVELTKSGTGFELSTGVLSRNVRLASGIKLDSVYQVFPKINKIIGGEVLKTSYGQAEARGIWIQPEMGENGQPKEFKIKSTDNFIFSVGTVKTKEDAMKVAVEVMERTLGNDVFSVLNYYEFKLSTLIATGDSKGIAKLYAEAVKAGKVDHFLGAIEKLAMEVGSKVIVGGSGVDRKQLLKQIEAMINLVAKDLPADTKASIRRVSVQNLPEFLQDLNISKEDEAKLVQKDLYNQIFSKLTGGKTSLSTKDLQEILNLVSDQARFLKLYGAGTSTATLEMIRKDLMDNLKAWINSKTSFSSNSFYVALAAALPYAPIVLGPLGIAATVVGQTTGVADNFADKIDDNALSDTDRTRYAGAISKQQGELDAAGPQARMQVVEILRQSPRVRAAIIDKLGLKDGQLPGLDIIPVIIVDDEGREQASYLVGNKATGKYVSLAEAEVFSRSPNLTELPIYSGKNRSEIFNDYGRHSKLPLKRLVALREDGSVNNVELGRLRKDAWNVGKVALMWTGAAAGLVALGASVFFSGGASTPAAVALGNAMLAATISLTVASVGMTAADAYDAYSHGTLDSQTMTRYGGEMGLTLAMLATGPLKGIAGTAVRSALMVPSVLQTYEAAMDPSLSGAEKSRAIGFFVLNVIMFAAFERGNVSAVREMLRSPTPELAVAIKQSGLTGKQLEASIAGVKTKAGLSEVLFGLKSKGVATPEPITRVSERDLNTYSGITKANTIEIPIAINKTTGKVVTPNQKNIIDVSTIPEGDRSALHTLVQSKQNNVLSQADFDSALSMFPEGIQKQVRNVGVDSIECLSAPDFHSYNQRFVKRCNDAGATEVFHNHPGGGTKKSALDEQTGAGVIGSDGKLNGVGKKVDTGWKMGADTVTVERSRVIGRQTTKVNMGKNKLPVAEEQLIISDMESLRYSTDMGEASVIYYPGKEQKVSIVFDGNEFAGINANNKVGVELFMAKYGGKVSALDNGRVRIDFSVDSATHYVGRPEKGTLQISGTAGIKDIDYTVHYNSGNLKVEVNGKTWTVSGEKSINRYIDSKGGFKRDDFFRDASSKIFGDTATMKNLKVNQEMIVAKKGAEIPKTEIKTFDSEVGVVKQKVSDSSVNFKANQEVAVRKVREDFTHYMENVEGTAFSIKSKILEKDGTLKTINNADLQSAYNDLSSMQYYLLRQRDNIKLNPSSYTKPQVEKFVSIYKQSMVMKQYCVQQMRSRGVEKFDITGGVKKADMSYQQVRQREGLQTIADSEYNEMMKMSTELMELMGSGGH